MAYENWGCLSVPCDIMNIQQACLPVGREYPISNDDRIPWSKRRRKLEIGCWILDIHEKIYSLPKALSIQSITKKQIHPMKRFSLQVILRIALILGNAILLAWIFGDMQLFFNHVILIIILIGQIWELIHYINRTNRELTRLFLAVKHADFSATFHQKGLGKSFKELENSMIDIIQSYRDVKIEKEAQYQFLQLLVNQIQIGIISLLDENIILINPIAEKILGIKDLKNWKLLEHLNPKLAEELTPDGKKLIEIKSPEGTKILATEIRTILMIDKHYKLITLQDINSEIEQKEIEAWHKLIRILTH